ncbi:lysosomal alpha-mannosidase-like isoform X1 [Schistocerca gregaria]|uniref:lysosomal alpha-mannosidase-like isoform X1 n=1 Tax=Schistocerca gregaria TaxID=7010 RepID=UPI00211E8D85|nr:lysosomal alpha-mannosidase-like isoform X1 [Schistocerca gregaria]
MTAAKIMLFVIGVILFVTNEISCVPRMPPKPPYYSKGSASLRYLDTVDENVCGYKACPKPKPGYLNVHLVAHTHDDVGWLKTVDQYYYGSRSMTQKAGVQYILDSVIQALARDPSKKFIYVETAFFWKWWKEQHDSVRHQVKRLVSSGRLEFTGGAWSMNDEAGTHYQSTIDQFTWGLRKLNDTFGECGRPRAGWQIDPFGHSREMASMFAQMGYDGLLFGRLDYQDKSTRLKSKTAEMIWQASANLGKTSELFTSVLFNTYSPPPGFCFDVLCADEPIIDDKDSPDYNVDERVSAFIKYAELQSQYYSSNNIVLTMGGDFTYQDAHMWYKNMDKIIRYVNANKSNGTKLNVFYSTPACYLKALNDQDLMWPVKNDDFFPYASDPHSYWTGYFTSRPTMKRFERLGNNFLQVCKQLYALASVGPEDWKDLNRMREAMGVMQHHDAITGTEKEHVAKDYARILSDGFSECLEAIEAAFKKIIPKSSVVKDELSEIPIKPCLKLNVSECQVSEVNNSFVVFVYNPLSYPTSHYVRLPVTSTSYSVKDPNGKEQITQLVPIPEPVLTAPGRMSDAKNDLIFKATDLPPLGFRAYYITKLNKEQQKEHTSEKLDEAHEIGHKKFSLKFDDVTGKIKSIVSQGHEIKVKQDFYYYKGFLGNNEVFENRSSGAYIFRPNGSEAVLASSSVKQKIIKGPLVDEVHQVFSDWISQVVRVYKGENHAELEWMVGPIPIEDNIGKEVITKFSSSIQNQGVFYTDSNGRELLWRKRNYRPTWNLSNAEPIAGNYYPVTTRILIRDKDAELAVIPDRAQGGSSIKDGEIELMVHRRLLHDDAFGVGEALNETAYGKGLIARGQHYIVAGAIKTFKNISLAAQERMLIQQKVLAPWIFLAPADDICFEQWQETYKMEYSGLKKSLPPNVQILTLEQWKGTALLLRIEHILEKTDDPDLSKPVTINLKDVFAPFSIKSARETTLGANQWLSDSKRLKWRVESNDIHRDTYSRHSSSYYYDDDDLTITLNPMQIRTFIIEVKEKFYGIKSRS